uniref:Uncharacterized protein n=1 Tax=Anguilla anguilla TaxID=7936 RepID=A0A0E9UZJ2_ANGAN
MVRSPLKERSRVER